jgi:hypothetical protein
MDSKLTDGGLRYSGCQVLSQLLPLGYPASLFPMFRRFSAESKERLTNSRFCDDFDCNDEPSHGNVTIEASKKPNATKASMSGSWSSIMDHSADLKSQHRTHRPYLFQTVLDAPSDSVESILDRWIGDSTQLDRNEVLLVLFHLKKQRLYRKCLKVPA